METTSGIYILQKRWNWNEWNGNGNGAWKSHKNILRAKENLALWSLSIENTKIKTMSWLDHTIYLALVDKALIL